MIVVRLKNKRFWELALRDLLRYNTNRATDSITGEPLDLEQIKNILVTKYGYTQLENGEVVAPETMSPQDSKGA